MRTSQRWCLALASLLVASSATAGQAWRWKEGGRWVYGDRFPKGADHPEPVGLVAPPVAAAAPAGYANEQAAKRFPVVVYGVSCPACEAAKKLLEKRKIPVTYKDPSTPELFEEFKKLSPNALAPVVMVGDKPLIGFEPADLNGALDDAGYEKNGDAQAKPPLK